MAASAKAASNAPRPIASLVPALLARKGAATPAMRKPNGAAEPLSDLDALAESQDDLGWNDMGEDPAEQKAERTSQQAPHRAPHNGRRAAFTLRLDPHRHLRLRIASALQGRSAQNMVTEALDRLLEDMPQLETLVATASKSTDKS